MKGNLCNVYWNLWELLTEKQRTNICGDYFDNHLNSVKMWDDEVLLIEIISLLEMLAKAKRPVLQQVMKVVINLLDEELVNKELQIKIRYIF